ncbi:MAG TPA: hypothetical protein VHZ25_07935 [Acidobacteriaceae bacterium]|jgi:hypothetical protein|nr:hypothetical protein [Acidobacteriaceae bacterium]
MRFRPALLSLLAPFSLLLVLAAVPLSAQTLSAAQIVFTFDHPQLQPAHYTFTVDETGAGRFVSKPGPVSDASDGVYPTPVDRPIVLDDVLRGELFRYARAHRYFASICATAQTNLAFTGNKTFTYSGPDGNGSCTFVWAADPILQRLTEELGAVAFTIEEGRRLDVEVRHDRLGLDAELATLQDAVKDRRASGLPNIADELHAIADNEQVMDRARKRALSLLASGATSQKRD